MIGLSSGRDVSILQNARNKVLILGGRTSANAPVVESLKHNCDVVQTDSVETAMEVLRSENFDAIFSDSADFLPLERALVSQQANLILNTLGEGVCIVDGEGRMNWSNKKIQAWPPNVREKITRTCHEAFDLFAKQVSPQTSDAPTFNRSKRCALNVDDEQFMEMIVSPVISPTGQVVKVVAVVWDATGTKRLQQKIDAIDKAGRELVRLEADAMQKLNVTERLKLLEDKIISFTRDLMHFDHFAIRVLDRRTNKLEMVISAGLPTEALNIPLFATPEGNGISGWVAAMGKSYICRDVAQDPRYVTGLDHAQSTLTVPLRLHDKVIGIFNVESRKRNAFDEDDRQFAEIFGRYVAIAINILDLMVVERVSTSHVVADTVCSEVSGPLNDISSDANALMEDYIGNDDLRAKLQAILDNVGTIRSTLRQAQTGTGTAVLGAKDVKSTNDDPLLAGAEVLVADDEPNIRTTISDVLKKYKCHVTMAACGTDAIALIEQRRFDLVVSDIKMPDKTGYEVFAAARRVSGTMPVILMTGFGYDPNHSIVRASQEGLAAVLFKPFKVDNLLTEVRKALQVTSQT
jgi:CheY-like chemotaxis protein